VKAFSLVLCLWSVAACRPPEAPETLDDLASFLFAHTWDEDEAYLQPGLENLMVWLDANFDQTSEGYEVTNITPEAVASVAGEDRVLEGLIGAAVGYDIAYPLADVVDVMLFEDPMEVYPGDYEFYDREFLSDTECFKERTCMHLENQIHLAANYPLGIVGESHTQMQNHWVETEAGMAYVHRNWTRWEPTISVDWLIIHQQYYMAVTLPKKDGTTRRLAAMWLDAEILNAGIPDAMALSMTIDTMASTGDKVAAYLAQSE
jgi:hypothetical protein